MLNSQGRNVTTSRRHDIRHHESDSDRPRQTTTPGQRYNTEYGTAPAFPDRYRSSKRPDVSGNTAPVEAGPSVNRYAASRDQSFANGPAYYASSLPPAQLASLPTAATAESSYPARGRAHEQGHETDVNGYARRKAEKPSPRSLEERLQGGDLGKPSRSSRQLGSTLPASAPLAGLPVNLASLNQSGRDPGSSSRHHRDRDRDREKDRERRREREREKERAREEEERVRARAIALEKEFERQKKREEKEARRAEREREKERERRREEKELERARRHREKERAREAEARSREEPRFAMRNSFYAQNPPLVASRQLNGSSEQVPSSSSNIALPSTLHANTPATTRYTTTDPRKDDMLTSSQPAPPHVSDKDRRSRRRERALMQQHAQESGMSSSEQEHSGRERASLRTVDRRYARRDAEPDPHGSGPSGSENERAPSYKQRKYRTQDPYAGYRPSPYAQTSGAAPLPAQYNATVGPASSQHTVPRVVSIRAGQGPADPEAPPVRTKTPFASQHTFNSAYNQPVSSHGVPVTGTQQTNPYTPSPYVTAHQAPVYVSPAAEPPAVTQSAQIASRPSPHQHQPSLPPKALNGTPPTKAVEPPVQPDAFPHGSYAKFNVYRAPGPAVTAEVSIPTTHQPSQTQFVTVNSTTVKDLAAKFPLNEDFLTSASSSTLDMGTGRSAQGFAAPGQGLPQVVDLTDHNVQPARSALPDNWLNAQHTAATPSKQSGQPSYPAGDISASVPRGTATTPAIIQRDTRPPQPNVVAYAPYQTSRPQPTPLQPKPPTTATPSYYSTNMPPATQPVPPRTVPPAAMTLSAAPNTVHATSNSPARSTQQPLQRSPSTLNAVPLGTPKQSSSIRLKGRNGSSDTVVYPVGKASPSQATKPITHRTSNSNIQANASLRPDTNTARPPNVTTEYPDISRYRLPPSAAYPNPPHTAPVTSNPPAPYSQPTHAQHSRSASQPSVPNPYDYTHNASRSQTMPAPAPASAPTPVPPSPAAAPSASAIAAAYRSGLYNTETSAARTQDKRVPPRAAPSPAPLPQPLPTQPPSILAKSGYALPNPASQPSRGQASTTQPATGRANASAMAPPSRGQPDAQNALLSTRVAISGHPSTPAPTKAQLTSPSEQELLMTPSSLAPSMLKGGNTSHAPFPTSRPPPPQSSKPPSTKEGRKKGGLFSLFRSRSSPPKQDARVPDPTGPEPVVKPRQRSTSQTTINAVAASVRNIIAPHPNPGRHNVPNAPTASSAPRRSGEQSRSTPGPPPSFTPTPVPGPTPASAGHPIDANGNMRRMAPHAPTPVHANAAESHLLGRSNSNSRMFTPFRLVSKRHRTVSAASNEAADGTATNTVIGGESARSSTAGRPSPPLRDPFAATQDWRNKEEAELVDRGTWRRRRPGVVFDVSEEFTDTETYHVLRKASRA